MMRAQLRFSTRAAFAVLVLGLVVATAGLTTATDAGASGFGGASPPPTATFSGATTPGVADPSCPRAPGFPGVNGREQLTGIVHSRLGSGRLTFDYCRIFAGALGGIGIQGTFTLTTRIGTLRGTTAGAIVFDEVPNAYRFTSTVQHGTFLLSHVTGTLSFDAVNPTTFPGPITGTVTPHLTLVRGPGHCSHPVPWAPSA